MIDFSNTKALTIPEGSVAKIEKITGELVWTKPTEEPTINFLEYLRNSTSENHVDTCFKPNQNTSLTVKFKSLDATQFHGIAGCRDTSYSFCFFTDTSTWRADYCTTQSSSSYAIAVGEEIELTLDKNSFRINGVQYNDFAEKTFTVSQNIWLLGVNNRGTKMNAMKQDFISAQIRDDGVLVRDYRPAIDSDGTECLYESVERKYYYLDGTNAAA